MPDELKGFRLALSFLTRLPGGAHAADPTELAHAVVWFPVVGTIIGLLIAACYGLASQVWVPIVAAVLALAAGLLFTGAFHEDGLADTFDAFVGGNDRDGRLRILKDPTLGTFGVAALVVSLLLRAGAIATLSLPLAIAAVPAAHALSRSAAVALLGLVSPVGEGLGAAYGAHVSQRRALVTLLIGVVITAALLPWPLFAGSLIATGGIALLFARFSVGKVGGVTGDVLGATQQVCEIAVLLIAAAFA